MHDREGSWNPLHHLAPSLRCPTCGGPLRVSANHLQCVGAALHDWGSIHDVPDLVPDLADEPTLAQRFMESPAIAGIYEDRFRPGITRLVGGVPYDTEDAWLAAHFAPVPGTILDVACGTGRITRWLARGLGVARVVGIDVSRAMLERARQPPLDPGLTWLRASAQQLPFADATLGGATTFGALHLFPDPPGAIAELGRALRDGAPLVGMTASPGTGPWQSTVTAAATGLGGLRMVHRAELEDWLDDADLVPRAWHEQGAFTLFAAVRRRR